MIPKLKLLFINGPLKGQKYLLEPSQEENGKTEFTIGSDNTCDIIISDEK
jgi:hypothetical protein